MAGVFAAAFEGEPFVAFDPRAGGAARPLPARVGAAFFGGAYLALPFAGLFAGARPFVADVFDAGRAPFVVAALPVFAALRFAAFAGAFFAGEVLPRLAAFPPLAGAFAAGRFADARDGDFAAFFAPFPAAFAGALRAGAFFAAPFFMGFAALFFAGFAPPFFAEPGAGFDAFFTVVLRTVFVDFAERETFLDAEEREAGFLAAAFFVFDLAFAAMRTSSYTSVSGRPQNADAAASPRKDSVSVTYLAT